MLRSTQTIHSEVPEVVVLRLPIYARVLNQLIEEGTDVISSQQLGDLLQMTPAQIRKDLSYFVDSVSKEEGITSLSFLTS